MGNFNFSRFFSDFATRTRENQRRIEYISNMAISHDDELDSLYAMTNGVCEKKSVNS